MSDQLDVAFVAPALQPEAKTTTQKCADHFAFFWLDYLIFFWMSVISLGTVLLASLQGVMWSTLPGQERFLIIVAIIVNYGNTVVAFCKQTRKRLRAGQDMFDDDTTTFTKVK